MEGYHQSYNERIVLSINYCNGIEGELQVNMLQTYLEMVVDRIEVKVIRESVYNYKKKNIITLFNIYSTIKYWYVLTFCYATII